MVSIFKYTLAVLNLIAVVAGSDKVVVGYWTEWTSQAYSTSAVPWELLTHVNYAFAIFDNKTWKPKIESPQSLKELVQKSKPTNTKILVSVGGWTGSKYFSPMVADKKSRSTFIKNTVDFVKEYGIDGIDIDWEYPNRQANEGNLKDPKDVENYQVLLKELKDALPKGTLITAAVRIQPFDGPNGILKDVSAFAKYFDFINIMAYDINGPWEPLTGPLAPLENQSGKGPQFSVKQSTNEWRNAGIPKDKLVVGVPFYGYQLGVNSDMAKGDSQYATVTKNNLPSYGFDGLIKNNILSSPTEANTKNGWTRKFDKVSKTPWLFNSNSKTFISYEDPLSLKHKTEYVRCNGYRGAMIWALNNDYDSVLIKSLQNVHNSGPCNGIPDTISPPVTTTTVKPTTTTTTKPTTTTTAKPTTTTTAKPTTTTTAKPTTTVTTKSTTTSAAGTTTSGAATTTTAAAGTTTSGAAATTTSAAGTTTSGAAGTTTSGAATTTTAAAGTTTSGAAGTTTVATTSSSAPTDYSVKTSTTTNSYNVKTTTTPKEYTTSTSQIPDNTTTTGYEVKPTSSAITSAGHEAKTTTIATSVESTTTTAGEYPAKTTTTPMNEYPVKTTTTTPANGYPVKTTSTANNGEYSVETTIPVAEYPVKTTTTTLAGEHPVKATTTTVNGEYPAKTTTSTSADESPVKTTSTANNGEYSVETTIPVAEYPVKTTTTTTLAGEYPVKTTTTTPANGYPVKTTSTANNGEYSVETTIPVAEYPVKTTTTTLAGEYPVKPTTPAPYGYPVITTIAHSVQYPIVGAYPTSVEPQPTHKVKKCKSKQH